MKKVGISLIWMTALLIGSVVFADICKEELFENPGAGMVYGLDNIRNDRSAGSCSYPVAWNSGTKWCVEHDGDGGDQGAGDGAAHVIFRAGQNQFNAGWYWSHSCGSWQNGDTMRIKFKIKFDSNYQWNQSHNNKFMIWGTGGYRMILFIRDEYWTSSNCRPLGSASSNKCTNDGSSCNSDSDCVDGNGVQYMCIESGSFSNSGGFSVGHDIGNPCAGPAEESLGGGLGNDHWLYIQVEVRSGSNGYEKIWVNNNNENEPNACTGDAAACSGSSSFDYSTGQNAPVDILTDAWAGEQSAGDFWTDAVSQDMGYYIDDMIWEQNGSFDASWYSGGASNPACGDGADNDGDGLTDFPADPGCGALTDTSEGNCGNGAVDGAETCDGAQLAGATCVSQGFDSGTLACAGNCGSYDTSNCVTSSGEPGGTPLFTSGFENGDWSEWNGRQEQTAGDLQVVADAGCPIGSYCARALLSQGTNSDNYADYYFGDYPSVGDQKVEEVCLTVRTRFDVGYVWPNSGHKVAILNATDGNSTQRRYQVILKVAPEGDWSLQHSYIDTWSFFEKRQNVGTPLAVPFGSWVRLKLYARMNTPGASDGILRLWVDGVLKTEYTNVDLRQNTAFGFGKLNLSSWATDASGSDGVQWFDDWVMSTTDPDAGTGGENPSTPTGVHRSDTTEGGV